MRLSEAVHNQNFNPQKVFGYRDCSFHLKSVTKFYFYLIYMGNPGLGPSQDYNFNVFEFEFQNPV